MRGFFLLEMAEETAGVRVLTQPPKDSPVQINRPWKHPKRAGSIPAVGWTRPRCKPTLALLSPRVRLQFVAHYFTYPEWTTYSWQPPGSTQHFPLPLWTPYTCTEQFMSCLQKKGVFSNSFSNHYYILKWNKQRIMNRIQLPWIRILCYFKLFRAHLGFFFRLVVFQMSNYNRGKK